MANYCTHCTDSDSGIVGCFMYDVEHYQETGKFIATSEIYGSLARLFIEHKEDIDHSTTPQFERSDMTAAKKTYEAFWKSLRCTVEAESSYAAQQEAHKVFLSQVPRRRKVDRCDITVVLVEKDGEEVIHTPTF